MGEQVRAALRAATQHMVEGAPYEELTSALDAVAAMPGADELRAEIAGRRLALLEVHHRDAVERERVLQSVVDDLASVPLPERVRWIAGAGRYGELVARYLRPLRPELQAAVDRDPGDDRAQEALWLGRRSYEEITEALDAVLELPGGAQAAGLIASERLLLLNQRDQDDAEAERVLAQVASVLATFSLRDRVSAISLVCSGRPALSEKHMPPLIAALEEELRRTFDAEGEATLAGLERRLEHTRADAQPPWTR